MRPGDPACRSGRSGSADRIASHGSVVRARRPGGGLAIAAVGFRRPARRLLDAARTAAAGAFDWLLAVSAAETLSSDIFAKTAPALRLHDAVWGGAGRVVSGTVTPLERITRLAAQDLPTFFHAALRWWIGPTHFVRPDAALPALHSAAVPACTHPTCSISGRAAASTRRPSASPVSMARYRPYRRSTGPISSTRWSASRCSCRFATTAMTCGSPIRA